MMAYEAHLKSMGICPNSISFYMRNLRSIYNRAVEKGLVAQHNPFCHVYAVEFTIRKEALHLFCAIRQCTDSEVYPYPRYSSYIFSISAA